MKFRRERRAVERGSEKMARGEQEGESMQGWRGDGEWGNHDAHWQKCRKSAICDGSFFWGCSISVDDFSRELVPGRGGAPDGGDRQMNFGGGEKRLSIK